MKTGYHAVYAKTFFEGINDAIKYGFDFVQFDLGVPAFFLNDLTIEDLQAIRDHSEDQGVEITFHSPGDNVSLFSDYPLIRGGILDEFKLILEKANILNARHITFHAGTYPQFRMNGQRSIEPRSKYYEQILYENLLQFIADSGNTLINVENSNLNDSTRSVLHKLIAEGAPLFLTLDTAKLYSGSSLIKEDLDFFKEHEQFIREIHIHDLIPGIGTHQTAGTGIVDFNIFRQFMNEDVYINHEVRPVEAAVLSRDNLAELLK